MGATFKPHKTFTITPEFRLDYFSSIDAALPQVRARMGWQPVEQLRLSLAGGRYEQAPSPEEISEVTGNPDLRAESAWHVNLGAQIAPGPWLDLDVQGYFKYLENQVVSSNTASSGFGSLFDLGDLFSTPTDDPTHGLSNEGQGRIYGMEVFARFGVLRGVGITGWLGYSLSFAERKDFEGEEWRWFQHDRRHAITALVQIALPGEVSIGARFQLQTGAPKTPIEDSTFYADAGAFIPTYGELYSARGLPFHQLDLRIDKRFREAKHTVDIYIDVQNVYAAKNSDFQIPTYDYREEVGFFTIPTINFAIRVEF